MPKYMKASTKAPVSKSSSKHRQQESTDESDYVRVHHAVSPP